MSTLDAGYLATAIAVVVAITFSLRVIPFIVKKAVRDSALLASLNVWMPVGVSVILAIYCLSGIDLHHASRSAPELIAVVVTVAVHRWRHNMLLSILVGTSTCIVLATWVVPALT